MFSVVLKKIIILSVFLQGSLLFAHVSTSENEYDQLLQTMITGSQQSTSRISTQQRFGVKKNLLFRDAGKSLRFSLTCERSDIQLVFQEERKMEVIEDMHNMSCIMQENEGIFQVIQADIGAFFYQKRELKADSVMMSRYFLPNTTWEGFLTSSSERPLMVAQAQTINCLLNKGWQFSAWGVTLKESAQ